MVVRVLKDGKELRLRLTAVIDLGASYENTAKIVQNSERIDDLLVRAYEEMISAVKTVWENDFYRGRGRMAIDEIFLSI